MYKKFLKKTIHLVVYGAVLVVLIISCMYMVSMVRFSSDNLNTTTTAYCRQINNALEMLLSQSKHHAYRFVLDDNGISELVDQMRQKHSTARDLMRLLTKTIENDPYYESVYLYSEADDWIMISTETGNTSIFKEAEFEDQEIVEAARRRKGVMLEPRLVQRFDMDLPTGPRAKELILPIIVPLKASDTAKASCMMVININIGDVFVQLLDDADIDESIDVYITDDEGKIIVAKNHDCLGTDFVDLGYDEYPKDLLSAMFSGKKICYQAQSVSHKLGWTLHMARLEDSRMLLGMHISTLLVAVVVVGAAVILLASLAMRRAMRPVSELDNKSYEQSIKEQMLNPGLLPDRAFTFRHDRYFVTMIQFPEHCTEALEKALSEEIVWPENAERHLIPIQVGHTALLISFNGGEERDRFWRDWLEHTHRRLETVLGVRLFFTVSTMRKSTRALSEAYQETMLLINYTMQSGEKRVMHRSEVTPTIENAVYPEAAEKQLVNNLLIGDLDTCRTIIGEFVDQLFDEHNQLQNQVILVWLGRLQNRVLVQANAIPLRLPDDIQNDFSIWDTRESIHRKLLEFAQVIVSRVNKRTVEKHENMEQRIREYVQQNFTDPNFSFTSICDHFSIGRSQLTAIFREKMGGSFSEYVNDLKIKKAKMLLGDRKLTIDTIAHEAGFSYAHYFIKVFKNKEGITPGQYREHIGLSGAQSASDEDNDNALL